MLIEHRLQNFKFLLFNIADKYGKVAHYRLFTYDRLLRPYQQLINAL